MRCARVIRGEGAEEEADEAFYGGENGLTIDVVGVNRPYQGQRNPLAPDETFAASMFRVIEDFAASKAGCVGLSLWVRSTNGRAIRFYEKAGFVADPGGPVQRDAGAAHQTMRKLRG